MHLSGTFGVCQGVLPQNLHIWGGGHDCRGPDEEGPKVLGVQPCIMEAGGRRQLALEAVHLRTTAGEEAVPGRSCA